VEAFSIWDVLIRLGVAVICGGMIGIDRGKKHRPAGFRTHMLVCIGAALTMMLGIYLSMMITNVWSVEDGSLVFVSTDVSRFGAQVINGIGFLGAGTIIVTGKQQVKGMTTAAGLWASACMGIAIGAGFFAGALIGCILIITTIVIFSKLEHIIMKRTKNINLYVEFEHLDDLTSIIERIKATETRIFDVELTKNKSSDNPHPYAIFSLRLPKNKSHAKFVSSIAELETIRTIEEL
jgi:putative Mg2+ transporter-C (MgtC) family protein